jgi:GNAT superfamily N-acetyltransferase
LPSPDYHVERVHASLLYGLRRRILSNDDPDKNVVDPRDDESTSLHFGGFLGDRIVVSASFFPSPAPVRPELVSLQLRYMATDLDVQGQGFGAELLTFALDVLREHGVEQVWANARDSALGFYRATGWDVLEGSEHISTLSFLPHSVISKMLVNETGLMVE